MVRYSYLFPTGDFPFEVLVINVTIYLSNNYACSFLQGGP